MAMEPTFTTILTQIKDALLEIEQEVYNVPAVPFGSWQTGELPRWTNNLREISDTGQQREGIDYSILQFDVLLVVGSVTAGIQTHEVNEYEELTQIYLGEARNAFKRHNHLQTATYPRGIAGIAPEGITVGRGLKGMYKPEPFGSVYTVLIPLSIPIVQRYNTES